MDIMNIINIIFKCIFAVFLIYTLVFIAQWLMALVIAVYRFAQYKENCYVNKTLLSEDIMDQVGISVIIPAYNEENCIIGTVESLLNEDYSNLQIIIVDDGSKDNMKNLLIKHYDLDQYEQQTEENIKTEPIRQCYRRIVRGKEILLISKKNGGKADALNCGLNLCNRKYCVVLDADTKVQKSSLKTMCSRFLQDKDMIVCAGVVGDYIYGSDTYKKLSFIRKALVIFQQLEYYRTFYMQRIMFDKINANVVVSGAFAMFDTELVKKTGGYKVNTIGEDMEITMRLHAFCRSQKKHYHIGYIPEVKCETQVPFSYKDYYQQRRRWHIGMIQSMKEHEYMLGSLHYGGAGLISSTFLLFYELWAPFIEIIGMITIIMSLFIDIVDKEFMWKAILIYIIFAIFTQLILVYALNAYKIEKISIGNRISLIFISIFEIIFFHPFNIIIKLGASFKARKYRKTWKHLNRMNES